MLQPLQEALAGDDHGAKLARPVRDRRLRLRQPPRSGLGLSLGDLGPTHSHWAREGGERGREKDGIGRDGREGTFRVSALSRVVARDASEPGVGWVVSGVNRKKAGILWKLLAGARKPLVNFVRDIYVLFLFIFDKF